MNRVSRAAVVWEESRRLPVAGATAGGPMPERTDISFTSDGLRTGARLASATADAAAGVTAQIDAIEIDAAAFGALPAAAAVGTALAAFRDSHAELSRQVQLRHADLAGRAAGTASGGDQLVRDTSATARTVPVVPGIAP